MMKGWGHVRLAITEQKRGEGEEIEREEEVTRKLLGEATAQRDSERDVDLPRIRRFRFAREIFLYRTAGCRNWKMDRSFNWLPTMV